MAKIPKVAGSLAVAALLQITLALEQEYLPQLGYREFCMITRLPAVAAVVRIAPALGVLHKLELRDCEFGVITKIPAIFAI